MKNKIVHKPGENRVIGFIENNLHTILIDQNSNMLQNLFEFFTIILEIRNKKNETNNREFKDFFSIGYGEFSKRIFFKISIQSLSIEEFNLLINFLDHNLILYANEN